MRLDSKKELEKRLKTSCESYIMGVTKLTVEPMLSFITKVTATRVASTKKPLKDHAFATPRSWVHLSHLISGGSTRACDDGRAAIQSRALEPILDLTTIELLATSCVGASMARAFAEFLDTYEHFNADDILRLGRWPDLTRGRAAEVSARMRLVDELADALRRSVKRDRADLTQRHVHNVVAFLCAEGMTEEIRWRFVRQVDEDLDLRPALAEFGEYDELARRIRKEVPVR